MRAAILRGGEIVVDDVPEPTPSENQVLLETIACGICGSDLHAREHADEFIAASRDCGMAIFDWDTSRDVVMGHEFSARVLDVGRGVSGIRAGQEVVAHPVVTTAAGFKSVGYANDFPGGYGQRMIVNASGVIPLPTGSDAIHAALTEPIAVGLHAVNASWVDRTHSAIVLGCGPVGLAVIAALQLRDVPLIVAADFSPIRRARAAALGAHVTVDPRREEAVSAWRAAGGHGPTVLFDAVGVPGMIDTAMRAAPRHSQVLVVGLCMPSDQFKPAIGINKELTLSFVLGWTPEEFAMSMRAIASGELDVSPLITGHVPIEGVAAAFESLASPDDHVKILVRPNGT